MPSVDSRSSRIRPAAVAGMFYPADPVELRRTVDVLLAEAARTTEPGPAPKALVVPHAGYVYSGPIAASGYVRLAKRRGAIRRVVLLGPAHRVWFDGLALPDADAMETPLGSVRVASEAAGALPGVVSDKRPHASEHSLEVHLPFIQRVLGDVEVVPLVVGDAEPEDVADVIDALWGGEETAIVVSSDLSHYLPWSQAVGVDRGTANQIHDLGPLVTHEQACGATPVDGLLLAARRHKLDCEILDLRNSGDTAGARDQVVGYGAFAFHERPNA